MWSNEKPQIKPLSLISVTFFLLDNVATSAFWTVCSVF